MFCLIMPFDKTEKEEENLSHDTEIFSHNMSRKVLAEVKGR